MIIKQRIDPYRIIRHAAKGELDTLDLRIVAAIADGMTPAHKTLARYASTTPRTIKRRLAKLRALLSQ